MGYYTSLYFTLTSLILLSYGIAYLMALYLVVNHSRDLTPNHILELTTMFRQGLCGARRLITYPIVSFLKVAFTKDLRSIPCKQQGHSPLFFPVYNYTTCTWILSFCCYNRTGTGIFRILATPYWTSELCNFLIWKVQS